MGARPQFIKARATSSAIAAHNRRGTGPLIEETVLNTGQHYDYELSRLIFEELELPAPACNLEIGSGVHGAQTARALAGAEAFLLAQRPDLVMVFGDTNSTLAGALAAAKLALPVAHVEAGLRCGRRDMPEEINRILTDHLAALLFCPNSSSAANLRREGIVGGVHVSGDVMLDNLQVLGPRLADIGRRELGA